MDLKSLSKIYYLATARMQESAIELYESLHTNSGDPRTDAERMHNTIRKYKRNIDTEFDLIRSALLEYYDNTDLS
jgi:hypothetical protein